MFILKRYPLARIFMLISLVILVTGMLIIGFWVGQEIQVGVINQTAQVTGLYVEGLLTEQLNQISPGRPLSDHTRAEIDRLFVGTAFGKQIISFKLWTPDGTVLYSTEKSLIGQHFVDVDLDEAVRTGTTVSSLSDLDRPENYIERLQWQHLIETYAPLRGGPHNTDIIAVAEFYLSPQTLTDAIQAAQLQTWIVVGIATTLMYIALNGMVGQASRTIRLQQQELERNIEQLQGLLTQNRQLHERVSRAAARTTALNEQLLRRISSDLHDGPAQDVSLALLRLDSLVDLPSAQVRSEFEAVRGALQSAMEEIRSISAGLRLPEINQISAEETVRRAVRDYQRKSDSSVKIAIGEIPADVPLSVRITLYRIVQESLSNSYRHAGGKGQAVSLQAQDAGLAISVSDAGPGFNVRQIGKEGHLGLVGMQERVEMLGGVFNVHSGEHGTVISALLPLADTGEQIAKQIQEVR